MTGVQATDDAAKLRRHVDRRGVTPMKIGILTMSRAYNFGALLQAYALKTSLQGRGHQVRFVNYATPMQLERYAGVFEHGHSARVLAKNAMRVFHYASLQRGVKRYKAFITDALDGAGAVLTTKQAVEADVRALDALVVGSDQMWNTRLPDVSDVYFLDFAYPGCKLSYAVSFGDRIPFSTGQEDAWLQKIRQFDRITVREQMAKAYLQQQGIASTVVADPTLLLSRQEWEAFAVEETALPAKGFVFYYSVRTNPHTYRTAQKIGRLLGVPVITSMLTLKTEVGARFKRCFDIGPRGFVDCIRQASCVCTDSFHGTLFSLLFEKPFVTVFKDQADMAQSARCGELLKMAHEERRGVTEQTDLTDLVRTNASHQAVVTLREYAKTSLDRFDAQLQA